MVVMMLFVTIYSVKSSDELHQKIAALNRELLSLKADYDRLLSSLLGSAAAGPSASAAASPMKPIVMSADAQRELMRSLRSRMEVMKLLIAAINALCGGPQIPNTLVCIDLKKSGVSLIGHAFISFVVVAVVMWWCGFRVLSMQKLCR